MAKMPASALQQSVGDDPKKPPEPYETASHLDTLIKAHEIMSDPVKMKAVHKLAGRHKKAVSGIRSIQQIKDISNQRALAKGNPLGQLAQGDEDSSQDE